MTKKKKIICGVAAGLAAFVLIALIVTLGVCKYLLDDMFGRVSAPEDYSVSTTYSDSDTGVERREIEFKSGKNTLRGNVWGSKESKKLVIKIGRAHV